jgi:hypothetical protein
MLALARQLQSGPRPATAHQHCWVCHCTSCWSPGKTLAHFNASTCHNAPIHSAGLNYFQSITPSLSAGGEFFWLGGQLRSGLGLALRHTGEQHIATCQVATTGILSAQYAHKVTDKVRACSS